MCVAPAGESPSMNRIPRGALCRAIYPPSSVLQSDRLYRLISGRDICTSEHCATYEGKHCGMQVRSLERHLLFDLMTKMVALYSDVRSDSARQRPPRSLITGVLKRYGCKQITLPDALLMTASVKRSKGLEQGLSKLLLWIDIAGINGEAKPRQKDINAIACKSFRKPYSITYNLRRPRASYLEHPLPAFLPLCQSRKRKANVTTSCRCWLESRRLPVAMLSGCQIALSSVFLRFHPCFMAQIVDHPLSISASNGCVLPHLNFKFPFGRRLDNAICHFPLAEVATRLHDGYRDWCDRVCA